MTHLHFNNSATKDEPPPASGTACGVLEEGDQITDVALWSDCDDCRAAYLIGPKGQAGCGVRQLIAWKEEPHPKAQEILADVAARKAL